MSGRCETDAYPPCRTVVMKDSTEGAEVQNRLKQFRHLYVGDGADPGQYTRFILPHFLLSISMQLRDTGLVASHSFRFSFYNSMIDYAGKGATRFSSSVSPKDRTCQSGP